RERDRVGLRERLRRYRALLGGERRGAREPGGRGRRGGASAILAGNVGFSAVRHAAAPGQGSSHGDGRAREDHPRRSMLAHVAASLWGESRWRPGNIRVEIPVTQVTAKRRVLLQVQAERMSRWIEANPHELLRLEPGQR